MNAPMAEGELVFSELEPTDVPALVDAIAAIGEETGAHNQDALSFAAWRWQYQQLPTGTSFVYIVKRADEIVGYYHVATYDFLADDEKLRIGQIQSVAVSPSCRGQGVFRRLADFAHAALMDHIDLIYTFPNQRSIHTFLKYNNYQVVKPLPMFLLPLQATTIIRSRRRLLGFEAVLGGMANAVPRALRKRLSVKERLVVLQDLDDDVVEVFRSFQDEHELRLLRSRPYLEWRYRDTPKGEVFFVGLEREGILAAVAVVKYDELFSNRGLLVVDFAHTGDDKDLLKLLSNIPSLFGSALPESAAFILVSALAPVTRKFKNVGFVKVPQRFVPRQLNLLARWMRTQRGDDLYDAERWLVTLGDWDVF
jgi:ribosomal protein S18 acetylase RimI-like enzyme